MKILFIIISAAVSLVYPAYSAEHPLSDCPIIPPSKYIGHYLNAYEEYPNGLSACGLSMQGYIESKFRIGAVSRAGAIGIAQFMPATAKELGINPRDPSQAIMGQARYMHSLMEQWSSPHYNYDELIALSLASYNYGRGRLLRKMRECKCSSWEDVSLYLPYDVVDYVETIRYADINIRYREIFIGL